VLTGILFGLAPILRLLRDEVHHTIREGSRTTSGVHRQRVQGAFVVAQFGMAVMLVVGAGLLLRSFGNVRAVNPGFVPGGVLTVELDVPSSVAPTNQEVTDFYEQLERRIADLPGVVAVGDATTLPLGEQLDYDWQVPFVEREVAMELDPRAYMRSVSPGFFEAMRASIVAGRDFTDMDRVGQPGVVIVNEVFARQFFPGEDPLGERVGDLRSCFGPLGCVHIYGDQSIFESEIVGVVADIKYDGIRADAVPAIYFSGLQSSVKRRTIVVRSSGATAPLLDGIRRELAAMNPSLALTNVQTLDEVLSAAQSRDRFSALLLTLFGVVALLLAAVGVYGVLSQAVAQRRTEVGIRMALGADRGSVRGMVLADGLKLVGVGLVLGTVAALLFSGALSSQLFGVDPRDPRVYAPVVLTLLGVGVLASLLPAWRATRVDPAIAMRAD
jgi:predicted permease